MESVLKIYKLVLTQQLTYDQADRWAWSMMELDDANKLIYEPPANEQLIWDLITYLYGIDMPNIETGRPYRQDIDIIDFLKENDVYSKLQLT